ncbi:methylenetetrahydrofolate reductase [NAD(P)H] [Membranihabitans maritimus]|uniref:methylenetetrahydrofolate reductase [NAD(P)H] n=1 Tax=Membranihabitans maritimus TaxID=2904244 RepID=UPI001F0081E4|nr:methylenetetrahydrofolate reductase [NAD(P)H] [Membranihabitans maritimus]
MKVTEYFEKAQGRCLASFEVLPPIKGGGIESIFKTLDPLMEFKPPFIDVTYHREEYVYKENKNGFYEKTSIRKRPGTVGICTAIMHRYGVESVPHLLCGGFTIEETEDVLIDLNFLGIKNILTLRGDARKFESRFVPTEGGHEYAIDLVKQVERMNNGIYLDANIENGQKTNFCIGVAGYPEKHFEAPNEEIDIQFTKDKIDAGGDYIVTQMFFDNKAFFKYRDKCRANGIKVPIVPGIKPLTKLYQLNSIPRFFFTNIPNELSKEMLKVKDSKKKVKEVGIEWCIQQCKELKEAGVPGIHFYTMGDSKTISKIAEAVF